MKERRKEMRKVTTVIFLKPCQQAAVSHLTNTVRVVPVLSLLKGEYTGDRKFTTATR